MNDLSGALFEIAGLFDTLDVPYAVMGGIAVRIYGIPRPTHDVDFTIAITRDRLGDFFRLATDRGYTIPENYQSGWVERIADMPLIKLPLVFDVYAVLSGPIFAPRPVTDHSR